MKPNQTIFRLMRGAILLVFLSSLLMLNLSSIALAEDVSPEIPNDPVTDQNADAYGPDLTDFPPGYNPLTGLPVSDQENLKLPVVMISITNYPVSARPQAGPSFAPYIYEIYISEGMTRWLTLFYGDYPKPDVPVSGECPIRTEPFEATGVVVGNYVWHDGNGDGLQSIDEAPISGVCVNLYDAETDELISNTSTDSNGYFGFNLEPEKRYYIKIIRPAGMEFTHQDVGGDDNIDSDANTETGLTPIFSLTDHSFQWDVGFKGNLGTFDDGGGEGEGAGDGDENLEKQEINWKNPNEWIGKWFHKVVIGPVRSGRLPYKDIASWFTRSCLVYAGKSEDVKIPGCASQFGSDETDINSAFMSIDRLKEIAKQNQGDDLLDYSGNAYSNSLPLIPASGDAEEITMFYNFLNQAKWIYDPLSKSYLRYTDLADGSGMFYPATDRLNGRHLQFQNVIVLFARHSVITPTIIDIHLDYEQGNAVLFRDGKAYKIVWNSYSDDYTQETGRKRPVKFLDMDGNPIPLHPGQTWVHIVTQITDAYEKSPGKWYIRFYAPPGAK